MSSSPPSPSEPAAIEAGTPLPELRVEVTHPQLVKFAGAVDDYEPLHFDHLHATGRGYDGVIAHGWLTGALMCRVAAAWPPLREARFTEIEICYRRPNMPGPSTYGGHVVRKIINDTEIRIELALWGRNPAGETIVEGGAVALLGGGGA